MLSAAVVGTCFIVSIGTLVAHAVDCLSRSTASEISESVATSCLGLPEQISAIDFSFRVGGAAVPVTGSLSQLKLHGIKI
jgi:hypothetical protein